MKPALQISFAAWEVVRLSGLHPLAHPSSENIEERTHNGVIMKWSFGMVLSTMLSALVAESRLQNGRIYGRTRR